MWKKVQPQTGQCARKFNDILSVTVYQDGDIRLSKAALDVLGNPQRITIVQDSDTARVGIMACGEGEGYGVRPGSSIATRASLSQFRVNIPGFTVTYRCEFDVQEKILVIKNYDKPLHTAEQQKRNRKPSSK